MTQHFLLSAEARTLSVRRIMELSNCGAFDLFRECRWGDAALEDCSVREE
jgi:hypothetical protein